jgi:hypothetical protein
MPAELVDEAGDDEEKSDSSSTTEEEDTVDDDSETSEEGTSESSDESSDESPEEEIRMTPRAKAKREVRAVAPISLNPPKDPRAYAESVASWGSENWEMMQSGPAGLELPDKVLYTPLHGGNEVYEPQAFLERHFRCEDRRDDFILRPVPGQDKVILCLGGVRRGSHVAREG